MWSSFNWPALNTQCGHLVDLELLQAGGEVDWVLDYGGVQGGGQQEGCGGQLMEGPPAYGQVSKISISLVKPLYQARESSLVPLRKLMKPLLLSSVDTFVHLPKI